MTPPANKSAENVISSSFIIIITVRDVDHEINQKLSTTIERILRKAAMTVVIAKDE